MLQEWSSFDTLPADKLGNSQRDNPEEPANQNHYLSNIDDEVMAEDEDDYNYPIEKNVRFEMLNNLTNGMIDTNELCKIKFISRRLRLIPETDSEDNVTRLCFENGTWARANYTGCIAVILPIPEEPLPELHLTIMYYMYWGGYCISLVFLLFALAIFLHYKSLWCLRNIIHTNLILCFALHNLTWIFYALIAHEIMTKTYQHDKVEFCFLPTMVIKYFIAAGFFWMFVEGVYLFVSVMFSFHTNRIRFWMCATIGWGLPFLLILFTSVAWAHHDNTTACWMEQYQLDYIFIVPVLAVLILNLIFLMIIMYIVVTKLQTTVRQEATRYKKAIKALFILCPLLGINYIVVIAQTTNEPMWLRLSLSYYNTIMSSIQGFLVAVFFCFRNNEVRNTVTKTLKRWRQSKHQNHSNSTMRDSINSDHQMAQGSPGRSDRLVVLSTDYPGRYSRTPRHGDTARSTSSRSADYSKLRNVIVMDATSGNLHKFKFHKCGCRKYNSLPPLNCRKLSGASVQSSTTQCSTTRDSSILSGVTGVSFF